MNKTASKTGFDLSEHLKKFGVVYALLALVIVNTFMNDNFFKLNTFWNLSIQVLPIMLTALGMLLVISSGGIDISVGSVMAIAAVMSGMVVTEKIPFVGNGILATWICAILISIVLGAFNGFIIAKFKIQPIIVTLILFIAGRGIAQLMNDGGTIVFYNNAFSEIGLYRTIGNVPIQLFISTFFIILFIFVLKKTTFGTYVQAIGENSKGAKLSGVNTTKTIIAIYTISAFMAGIAGIMEASRASSADPNTIGQLAELDAIAAVAVGGTSMSGGKARIMGTIIGALLIQLVTITINMNNIPFAYSRILKAIIIIAAVYLQKEKAR